MQYENQKYAELRAIKKLGHVDKNDDVEMRHDMEREEREKLRSELKQELKQFESAKNINLDRKSKVEEELSRMHEEDQKKLAEYRKIT